MMSFRDVIILIVLFGSSHGLYRVFSTVFAKKITPASDFCPPIQDIWVEKAAEGSRRSMKSDIILINNFDSEASFLPTCTFRSDSETSEIITAFLVGSFLSYEISWNVPGAGVSQPCGQRYMLGMESKTNEILIPRILCTVPSRSSESNLSESFVSNINSSLLWLYSSGKFGFTFPGRMGSISGYTFSNKLFVYLIFKTLIGHDCSIRVQQHLLNQKRCEIEQNLSLGCIVYNCTDEDRIFDEVKRMTDLLAKSGYGPEYIKQISSGQVNQDSNDFKNPKSQATSYPILRWFPTGAIVFIFILCRHFWRNLSNFGRNTDLQNDGDLRSVLGVPEEVRPQLEVIRPLTINEVLSTTTAKCEDKDLPPSYESLGLPSYSRAVGVIENYKNSISYGNGQNQPTCV